MRIAFLTTHLTGSGHLVRTSLIARAAEEAGHQTLLINGGRPLAHLDLGDLNVFQLPSLHVRNLDYATLRDETGEPAPAALLRRRADEIAKALRKFRPGVLVTETYPLGRRALANEFQAALDATDAVAVASVRDIPEPKPKRLREVETYLRARFRALLVHGSESFIPLSASWPFNVVSDLVHHTGYVAWPEMPDPIEGGVLVSVGGGTLGRSLLPSAAAAAHHSDLSWRILIGGPDAAEIKLPSAPNLTVEPARPDYRALLYGAKCSISLCGYNTAIDLAMCETPAILIPMGQRGEQEQLIRAECMSRFPGFRMLKEDQITPKVLASEVDDMCSHRRAVAPLATNGANETVRIVEEIWRTK